MTPITSAPFYLDWTFWATAIAALALILSQLPPVHELLKRAKLDLEVYSRIAVTHKVGNPNLQLHLIISNIGGRSIKIKNAIVSIKRDGKHIVDMPAENYLQNPDDKSTILFTRFSMGVKDEWAHIVNFLNRYSRQDEKAYRIAESNLKDNISGKRQLPENKDKLVEADPGFISPFNNMFDSRFIWKPGEYELQISIEANPSKASVKKTYRWTLFESDSGELAKYGEGYKYGDGIYWNSDRYPSVVVQIVEA